MSSGEKKIVSSVEDVISAVTVLLNDIRSNPDLEPEQKNLAMEKVGAVTNHLKDIHKVLFVQEMEETQSLADPLVVTNLTESLSQALFSKTDQLDEQDTEVSTSEPAKLRLVVTPENKPKESLDEDEASQELAKTPDNLPLIQGIDERIQDVLNEQEIFHFDEIAAFNEADVVRISNLLEDPFRVARENWIEQAALLAKDVQTKYSLALEGQTGFDRLSWVSAYNWKEVKFEQAMDNVVVHDELPTLVSDEDQAAINQDLVLKEKAMLEAELASLREQLSAQTTQATEMKVDDVDEDPHDTFDENIALSPRLQKVFEEPIPEQEEDMSQESSDFHSEAEGVKDGAMWHEEVSLAPDYVPPIVDEDESIDPEAEESQADAPATFEDQDAEMPADFIQDGDITLPHTRQRQDEYVNKAYDKVSLSEQDQEAEQESFGETGADPYLQRDLSSLAETIDLPQEMQESTEHFATQDDPDLDDERPPYFDAEQDTPSQPIQPEGAMPPPIPVMNGAPPPHNRPPVSKIGAHPEQRLKMMAANAGHHEGMQKPALRQMEKTKNGQDNQSVAQNGVPQPPAPPVPPLQMSQNPAPHRPHGPAGQRPLPPQGHPGQQGHTGQYAAGLPPRAPGHRPVNGAPMTNGQQLQHPRTHPQGAPVQGLPQGLRQDLPLDVDQHGNQFAHIEALNDQPLEKKKKPEVSAGFKLKAKKFAESLQRSFGGSDE